MAFSVADLHSYLVAPWSLPVRRACPVLSRQVQQCLGPRPAEDPRWSRPLYVQRWLGEAIVARATWQASQPGLPRYRLGRESEPCWSESVTLPLAGRALRPLEEYELLRLLGLGIERAYRIAQTPQEEIGQDLWTQTLLGTCQYIAQVYGELKRRYRAQRARKLLWQALQWFVTWGTEEGSITLRAPEARAHEHVWLVPALPAEAMI